MICVPPGTANFGLVKRGDPVLVRHIESARRVSARRFRRLGRRMADELAAS